MSRCTELFLLAHYILITRVYEGILPCMGISIVCAHIGSRVATPWNHTLHSRRRCNRHRWSAPPGAAAVVHHFHWDTTL